ncbi:MAG: multiprotein bridging factor aMBF1 [Candidatus Bathyarchaeia archaeon]
MRCEVCGKFVQGEPVRATIERANLLVCRECANLASSTWQKPAKDRKPATAPKVHASLASVRPHSVRRELDEEILVENYGVRIKNAREANKWTQEDLARRINEKASIIGKIETQKMMPDMAVVRKLEHIFNISLLVKASETAPRPSAAETKSAALTLADIVVVRKREPRDVSATSSPS